MKRVKRIYVFIFVLIAIIVLGVGYAAINNINLIINGTGSITAVQENFNVKFLDVDGHRPTITPGSPNTLSVLNDNVATFDVSALSKKGDTAIASIEVKNESNGVGARIGLNLSNSNTTYFKVTEHIEDTELQAGDITTVTVTIEMIITPIENDETTTISALLTASPIENSSATGTDSSTKIVPSPPSFSTDSWATIKTNVHNGNTDYYNIGDTREELIDGNYYTLRIANKEIGPHCGENDIYYSQTACGFVVEFADVLNKNQMRDSSTNVGGYPQTLVYEYLKDTLYDLLSEDLQTVIQPTRVLSGYGSCGASSDYFTSTDKLYLLSGVEVFGEDVSDNIANTTTQLEYYRGMESDYTTPWYANAYSRTHKGYNDGTTDSWWLRGADCTPGYYYFKSVSYGSSNRSLVTSSFGVAPAFRIS